MKYPKTVAVNRIPMLKVENIKKRFDEFLLNVPNLEFQRGKIYALTGPNGSGKSTFLSILNLLENPDSGTIAYKGEIISQKDSLDMRRKMVLVLENPYLLNTTVFKNITYGLKVRRTEKNEIAAKVEEVLKWVNLEGFGHRKGSELSRGELQRVAIARAIVLEPEILLLDEPFSNIDKAHIELVENLIRKISKSKETTVVFTTHNLLQAYRLSDEIYSMVEGSVVKGSIENLFHGSVKNYGDSKRVYINPQLKITVVTERTGDVHILIPPEDIILSRNPFESSARNVLKGTIKSIAIEGNTIVVCCNVGVEFTALITTHSFEKMKLSIGSAVFLTFKTTCVKVF